MQGNGIKRQKSRHVRINIDQMLYTRRHRHFIPDAEYIYIYICIYLLIYMKKTVNSSGLQTQWNNTRVIKKSGKTISRRMPTSRVARFNKNNISP